MMRNFFLALVCFLPTISIAQNKVHKAQLQKRPSNPSHEYFSPVPIVPITDGYSQVIPGSAPKEVELVIPEKEGTSTNGIMEVYFQGGNDTRSVPILVCDYASDAPRFYIDHNQNFDFTDDGPAMAKDDTGALWIELKNTFYPVGETVVKLEPMKIPNQKVRDNWKRNIKRKPKFVSAELTEPDLWFRALRFNILSADVEVDGIQFQLGLMDMNMNGLYNDDEDRILIGTYAAERMTTDLNDNNYEIGTKSPFAVGNKGFKIESIDKGGRSISFSSIDFSQVPSRLKIGDPLPSTPAITLNDKKVDLHSVVEKGKYNYIEFWGTWCKGCVQELPKIKAAADTYSDKLNIVGLHYGNISNERLKGFNDKHQMSWPQLKATQEAVESFKVSGYPYGILVDPEGKIAAFNLRIDEVIERLQ